MRRRTFLPLATALALTNLMLAQGPPKQPPFKLSVRVEPLFRNITLPQQPTLTGNDAPGLSRQDQHKSIVEGLQVAHDIAAPDDIAAPKAFQIIREVDSPLSKFCSASIMNYGNVFKAIAGAGFTGFVAMEYNPSKDPMFTLQEVRALYSAAA